MSVAFDDKYEIVIGLEVHCQLRTESKLFSPAPVRYGVSRSKTCAIRRAAENDPVVLRGVLPEDGTSPSTWQGVAVLNAGSPSTSSAFSGTSSRQLLRLPESYFFSFSGKKILRPHQNSLD